jgi:hypothetical protein
MAPRVRESIPDIYRKAIISALVTRYPIRRADASKILPTVIEQWGKLHRLEGGDTMHARKLVPDRPNSRDASFVRVRGILRY